MPMAIGSAVSERRGERRRTFDARGEERGALGDIEKREEGAEMRERETERKGKETDRERERKRRWKKTNKKGRSALFAAARS